MTTRRHRRNGLETTFTVMVTICFLPCICVIGTGIVANEILKKAKNYERPKTTARKRDEARRKEISRSTPRPLEPRIERHLTIGRDVIVKKEEEVEVQKVVEIREGKKRGNASCIPKRTRGEWVNSSKARQENRTDKKKSTKKVELPSKEQGNRTVEGGENEFQPVKLVKSKNIEAGRTDDQLQSFLFKLPFEVRRQIWEETLGGYVFHIYFVQAYRRMSHTRCKTRLPEICKNDDPISGPCRQVFKVPGARDKWGHSNLLSILQSCRRIYSEAIPILYTLNTFDFESLSDVLKLSLTVLPERMRLIKDVQWKRVFFTGGIVHVHHNPLIS